jgi:hypothetical protein
MDGMISGDSSVTGHGEVPEKRSSPITVCSGASRFNSTPSTQKQLGANPQSEVARLCTGLLDRIAVVGHITGHPVHELNKSVTGLPVGSLVDAGDNSVTVLLISADQFVVPALEVGILTASALKALWMESVPNTDRFTETHSGLPNDAG